MRIAATALVAATLAMATTAPAQSQTQAAQLQGQTQGSATSLASSSASESTSASSSAPVYTAADEAAGRAGDIAALRRTLQHYVDAGDFKTAVVWARLGADKDDTACEMALAKLLSGSDLGPPDLLHAFMWADIAAAKHDPDLGADAIDLRDEIRHKMDTDQIMDAKAAEGKWRAAHHH
jgi:hypothetical protein